MCVSERRCRRTGDSARSDKSRRKAKEREGKRECQRLGIKNLVNDPRRFAVGGEDGGKKRQREERRRSDAYSRPRAVKPSRGDWLGVHVAPCEGTGASFSSAITSLPLTGNKTPTEQTSTQAVLSWGTEIAVPEFGSGVDTL